MYVGIKYLQLFKTLVGDYYLGMVVSNYFIIIYCKFQLYLD